VRQTHGTHGTQGIIFADVSFPSSPFNKYFLISYQHVNSDRLSLVRLYQLH